MHRGAEELHAEDVQRLPAHVLAAHVDLAAEAEERGDGRGRDAVLPGAGLGDDARLAHALREQDLAERVVDLVRAGVAQVLALQVDARAAELARQALGEVERRRPADVVLELALELGRNAGSSRALSYGASSSSSARISVSVTYRRRRGRSGRARQAGRTSALRTSATNAAMRAASLMPFTGLPRASILSTPDDTSTAHGAKRRIASPTFAALNPPTARAATAAARAIDPSRTSVRFRRATRPPAARRAGSLPRRRRATPILANRSPAPPGSP